MNTRIRMDNMMKNAACDTVEREGKVVYLAPNAEIKQDSLFYLAVKRCFDIVCSSIAILVAGIPMLVIALLIRADSPGKALFRQERLGINGKPFYILKFRSMGTDAERDGAQWAKDDDERCTRIGRVLRKYRLDELPQFFNILAGQMSFVGPRPERKVFYDLFAEYIEGFDRRLLVKPGLTGLAQVNGGYDLKPEEKIVYDIYYINNRSVGMDLSCLWKTVYVVLRGNGAH